MSLDIDIDIVYCPCYHFMKDLVYLWLNTLLYICMTVCVYSPLVWGTKAFETYRPYQESTIDKDWLLWKQPTLQEILSLVDIKMLESSTEQFPYTRTLEV